MTDSMGYAIDIDVKIHNIIHNGIYILDLLSRMWKTDFLRMRFFHFDILTQHI